MSFWSYWFWPNPGNLHYGDMTALIQLGVSAGLVLLSFLLSFWRRRLKNPVTKKLSRSWATASFWFGIAGVLFVVSRVEGILFLAMRAMWPVWALLLLAYLGVQILTFRRRHYTVVTEQRAADPREKYLPGKKRK